MIIVKAVRYVDFHGREITARLIAHPISHAEFKDSEGKVLLAPVMGESSWATFVAGLYNDPSSCVEELEN